MTVVIVIFIMLGLVALCFVRDQATFERYTTALWNAIGKPAVNYFLVTTDKKIITRFLTAFITINSVNVITKLIFTSEVNNGGDDVKCVLGIEYGTFDLLTLLVDVVWLLAFLSTLYYLYKKESRKIIPHKKTLVVMYGARIADDNPLLSYPQVLEALDEDTIPADGSPFKIQMDEVILNECDNKWLVQEKFLANKVRQELFPFMRQTSDIAHVSLFGIAPMPLLVKLGTLLNEKYTVDVFQRHRNPANWKRLEERTPDFIVNRPSDITKQPVLVLSLSDTIIDRIKALYGSDASIWEVTVKHPNMDMMRTMEQQQKYCLIMRDLLSEMSKSPYFNSINVHMAVPVACAIELGRVWMPKAHKSLRLFDYDKGIENETITIE